MVYVLENEKLKASFRRKSAELISLVRKADNTELVWKGDKTYWGWSSPVLFPFVGAVKDGRYTYKGNTYEIPHHGFARNQEFDMLAREDDRITFVLHQTEETKKVYPFDFQLEISYELKDSSLKVLWKVTNPAEDKMYFSIGAHPAFMCPVKEGEKQWDGYLCFPDAEGDALAFKQIDTKTSCVLPEMHDLPLENRKAKIKEHLFDKDVLIIENRQAGMVGLAGSDGQPYLMLTFDAPLFGIWSPAGKQAPFICLEPWYGRSDAIDFGGTLEQREYGQCLDGGETFETSYLISVCE